jgi:nucleoid-associated protein YgaU
VSPHDAALAHLGSGTPDDPAHVPPPADAPKADEPSAARPRPRGILRNKTRVGAAALLSILILIAALVTNRGLRGGRGSIAHADRGGSAPHPSPPRRSPALTTQIQNPDRPPPPAAEDAADGAGRPPRPAADAERHPITAQVAQNAGPERPPLPLPQLTDAGHSGPESGGPVPPVPASPDAPTTGAAGPPPDSDAAPPVAQPDGGAADGKASEPDAAPSQVMLAALDFSKKKPEPTDAATTPPGGPALPPPIGASPGDPSPGTGEPALPLPVETPPSNPPPLDVDKPEGTADAPPPPGIEPAPAPPAQAEAGPDPAAPPQADGGKTADSPSESSPPQPGGKAGGAGASMPPKTPTRRPPAKPAMPGAGPSGTGPAPAATELPAFSPLPASEESSALPPVADLAGWTAIPNAEKVRAIRSTPHDEDAPEGNRVPPARVEDRLVPVPHVVQRGENFWTISRLYYNTGRFYKALWAANRATVPVIDRLYVGTTIQVPPPEALDRSLVEPPRPSVPVRSTHPLASRDRQTRRTGRESDVTLVLPVGSPAGEAGSLVAAEPDPSTAAWPAAHRPVHKVRGSETLRRIASDRLGDARRAGEILELNRDVLEDPHQLVPGMTLRLPADARSNRVVR